MEFSLSSMCGYFLYWVFQVNPVFLFGIFVHFVIYFSPGIVTVLTEEMKMRSEQALLQEINASEQDFSVTNPYNEMHGKGFLFEICKWIFYCLCQLHQEI